MRPRLSRRSMLLLALAMVLWGCGTEEAVPTTDGGVGSDMTHNQTLEQLGVKTNLPALKGADGKPVAPDYNPLSRKRRALQPLAEIYMAGVPSPAGGRQVLRDDSTESYDILDMGSANDGWAKLPKVPTAGDFDGDGRQEIALLVLDNDPTSARYKQLILRVVGDKADKWAVKEKTIATLADLSALESTVGGYYLKLDIAAGDIDGDGLDEIVATCLGDLWVIDDAKAKQSHGVLLSKTFSTSGSVSQFLRVAAGDTDGDGKAELVVADGQMAPSTKTGSVQYHIYDGLTVTTSGQVKVDAVSAELMTADVAIGDVDGDGLGEIVFSGRQTGAPGTHKVLVMDDGQAGYVMLKVSYSYSPIHSQDPNFLPLHRVETGDFDGDNVAEIVSFDQIIDDLKSQQGLVKAATLPHDVGWGTVLAVGDVTNDHRDDIVFLRGTNTDALVVVYGTDSNNNYVQHQTFNVADDLTYMTLTTVNTDDDSAIVEFKGHEVRFTSPRILAVLAAAPWHKGISTDNTLAGTSFGNATSVGVEKEKSLGFMVGWSASVEGRGLVVGGSLNTSLEASFDLTTSSSKTQEVAYTYTSTPDADKVVFAAIPFDVYYYKVLTSPRADEVGKKMVVNIPRKPALLFVDVTFFNANNGSFADLDGAVLGHTVGDPRSYPRETEIDKAGLQKSGGFYSSKMTVGQGTGFQTATISTTTHKGVGLAFNLDTKVEIQAGVDFDIGIAAGSAKTGPSFGFHFGFSYTITSGQTTTYEGSVGNIINGADWTNHHFTFGLYVQPTTFQGQKFPLIGYWVD